MTSARSMPKHHIQIVPQRAGGIDRHCASDNDAPLVHLAAQGRQFDPCDQPHDITRHFDRRASHEQAIDLCSLCQGCLGRMACHRQSLTFGAAA